MLRRHNNKKGQNTAEYAILIALVVAAIVAMQTYAQRALQARVQTSSTLLTKVGSGAGANKLFDGTAQYEPYYQNTDYTTSRNDEDSQVLIDNRIESNFLMNASKTGASGTSYDNRVNQGEDF